MSDPIGRLDKPFHRPECECMECLAWIKVNPVGSASDDDSDDNGTEADPMTNEEILAKASAAYSGFDSIGIDGGEVVFSESFDYNPETQEPHDAAWELVCEISDAMREVGLKANTESDHDTVWGTIVAGSASEDDPERTALVPDLPIIEADPLRDIGGEGGL